MSCSDGDSQTWSAGNSPRLASPNAVGNRSDHGVADLAFDVTYIKQDGGAAWDVGTYRMSVPQDDGTTKEDHGKYLTVWQRVGKNWLIAADAWSSDLPLAH